jgi:hypothetical protein
MDTRAVFSKFTDSIISVSLNVLTLISHLLFLVLTGKEIQNLGKLWILLYLKRYC